MQSVAKGTRTGKNEMYVDGDSGKLPAHLFYSFLEYPPYLAVPTTDLQFAVFYALLWTKTTNWFSRKEWTLTG
ncbi:hypothetical protein B0A55_02954 [Friedmanniomyces simplex]|uniref:Uncharacterized protein n=1 Tax=Friedmanniomyces simplex TaxID=329884 RepID=A0A4U0Y6I0_9PEZI|nr:hypothetical protein B0A55_02954 [Friedmanniomyces simplex]